MGNLKLGKKIIFFLVVLMNLSTVSFAQQAESTFAMRIRDDKNGVYTTYTTTTTTPTQIGYVNTNSKNYTTGAWGFKITLTAGGKNSTFYCNITNTVWNIYYNKILTVSELNTNIKAYLSNLNDFDTKIYIYDAENKYIFEFFCNKVSQKDNKKSEATVSPDFYKMLQDPIIAGSVMKIELIKANSSHCEEQQNIISTLKSYPPAFKLG